MSWPSAHYRPPCDMSRRVRALAEADFCKFDFSWERWDTWPCFFSRSSSTGDNSGSTQQLVRILSLLASYLPPPPPPTTRTAAFHCAMFFVVQSHHYCCLCCVLTSRIGRKKWHALKKKNYKRKKTTKNNALILFPPPTHFASSSGTNSLLFSGIFQKFCQNYYSFHASDSHTVWWVPVLPAFSSFRCKCSCVRDSVPKARS